MEAYLLHLIWLLPLLGILPTLHPKASALAAVRIIHLVSTGLNLLLAIGLTLRFVQLAPTIGDTPQSPPLLFVTNLPWLEMVNSRIFMGVDALSMLMVLLTALIAFAGVLASWNTPQQPREFFAHLAILVSGVMGVFLSFDLLVFFLFYEVALLPMYLLIAVWGNGKKEYAAMKLSLMLVGASALLLTGILALYYESGIHSFSLFELAQVRFSDSFQAWAFPVLFVGFGVLGAMFPFHTWSPDGHAAAPTAVSMLHAGVLMKLGGYGCLRVAIYLMPEGARQWMPWLLIFITYNIALGAFIAIRQRDLKYITAYSSVSHLGLVLLGLGALTPTGIKGAMLQMISHGLLTALFFCLIGMIYGRTHTRRVDEMGGLLKTMPFLGVSFLIAGLAGLGLPSLSGFVAEFTIFVGAFENANPIVRVCTVLAILSITTTAIYVLQNSHRMLHGPLAAHMDVGDATWREKIPPLLLIAALFAMGLFPAWMSNLLDGTLAPIIANLTR